MGDQSTHNRCTDGSGRGGSMAGPEWSPFHVRTVADELWWCMGYSYPHFPPRGFCFVIQSGPVV
ncbi:MAG: hypothetical protein NZ578_14530, partial [Candidatus Binatia bacterium]|nr:hypothetical protein [Candidatus Binatia bacterium]